MLTIIENVLDKDEVRQFRSYLDTARWHDGAASAGTLARAVKSNLQLDDSSEIAIGLRNHILRNIGGNGLFMSAALPRKIYPPKFNRYQNGGAYGTHVDSAIMYIPGTQDSLRGDLSATLFLSEPEEYDGGELQIETAFGAQSVKLAAGDMVLYPSSSMHRVQPVTRGARVASFFWIESLVAAEADRTLLFDLDQAIQALRTSGTAGEEQVLKLAAVYHNLLRRWATT